MTAQVSRIGGVVCGYCGAGLPPTGRGRPRVYCSDSCKSKAKRRRAKATLNYPALAPEGYPTDPAIVRRRTAEALVAALAGEPAAPPVDQLTQGILEVEWLAFRLAKLEPDLPRHLGGRAGELSKRIRAAKADCFPELAEVAAT